MLSFSKEDFVKAQKEFNQARKERDRLLRDQYGKCCNSKEYYQAEKEMQIKKARLEIIQYPYELGEEFMLAGSTVKVVEYNDWGAPIVARKLSNGGLSKRRESPAFFKFLLETRKK